MTDPRDPADGYDDGFGFEAATLFGVETALGDAVRLAGRAFLAPIAGAFAVGRDPLGIELPPYVASGSLTPEVLETIAALYLFAELEEAGVVPVAEQPMGPTPNAKSHAARELLERRCVSPTHSAHERGQLVIVARWGDGDLHRVHDREMA